MRGVTPHATTRGVTSATATGPEGGNTTLADALAAIDGATPKRSVDQQPQTTPANDWEAVRSNADIQYSEIQIPTEQRETSNWLRDLVDWLGESLRPFSDAIGFSLQGLMWILVGIGALLLLWLVWKLVEPIARVKLQREVVEDTEEGWVPDREAALSLLEQADNLAAQGNYDEATHLLLERSVEQIASARPDWLEPSSTAREIASLPALPDAARTAFRVIAERVERSLFALRRLQFDDWQAARAAYADFALADLRESTA